MTDIIRMSVPGLLSRCGTDQLYARNRVLPRQGGVSLPTRRSSDQVMTDETRSGMGKSHHFSWTVCSRIPRKPIAIRPDG